MLKQRSKQGHHPEERGTTTFSRTALQRGEGCSSSVGPRNSHSQQKQGQAQPMMPFSLFNDLAWKEAGAMLASIRKEHVETALHRAGERRLDDFLALISPIAKGYLEPMAKLSRDITRQRFGQTMRFFAPVYLSNECHNECSYCGFSIGNPIKRLTLNEEEALKEIAFLKKEGFCHILILTGESPHRVGLEYISSMLGLFKKHFPEVSIEIQPLEFNEYQHLYEIGLDGVTVFQETYNERAYTHYHKKGKKMDYHYRLRTAERAARSGIAKIGIGALFGLSSWRLDSYFTALHAIELEKRHWKTMLSVSFPRLRPAEGLKLHNFKMDIKMDMQNEIFPNESDISQLIFAYRIFHNDLNLVLSSRERAFFRNNIASLGITTMSAASTTNPGGYACYPSQSLEQFSVNDKRSLAEVMQSLKSSGLDPVLRDWMSEFR